MASDMANLASEIELQEVDTIDTKNAQWSPETDTAEARAIKKEKEQSVYFKDGKRRIDFVLTFHHHLDAWESDKTEVAAKKRKYLERREYFLQEGTRKGLSFEKQHCSESPDQKTHFILVHASHEALLRGAQDLRLSMPTERNNLEKSNLCANICCGLFNPKVPDHLEIESYFTAPFCYDRKEHFHCTDDEENFFSTAQRAAIVWDIMTKIRYSDKENRVGIERLMRKNVFTNAFPLHESKRVVDKKAGEKVKTDRQFLQDQWSHWTNWYKRQPIHHIRRYFGEKVGIYFAWLGFYTAWLLPISIIGFLVMLYGAATLFHTPEAQVADDVCNEDFRKDFYMCPLCDQSCDFWFLTDSCLSTRLSWLFDNYATVAFAIIMSLWAILFLEFWKRKQFVLQYDWGTQDFEILAEPPRLEFQKRIAHSIRKCSSDKAKRKFYFYNPVVDAMEYVQPSYWFYPKFISAITVLVIMVMLVVVIVIAVILYRLAVAGAIYALTSSLPIGPSIGSLAVTITASVIQLVAILIMNFIYRIVATVLNNWEWHRTQTEYEDNLIFKQYLFQFFNFYTSLFYIAFIKGNISGAPGNYNRLTQDTLRFDECPTYGCMLELTIQVVIFMVGKQALNQFLEIIKPYIVPVLTKIWRAIQKKRGKLVEEVAPVYTRWEKDYDLQQPPENSLFPEYLELVVQYGFTTIFVAALPLAPFLALLNNWFEIRLDAHKFIANYRRVLPERAQDIGLWFSVLTIIGQLSVLTNGLIIAITSNYIPTLVYRWGGHLDNYEQFLIASNQSSGNLARSMYLAGYQNWSLSAFTVDQLLDGRAFPSVLSHELLDYDAEGNSLDTLYQPYIDFDCLGQLSNGSVNVTAFTRDEYIAFYESNNISLLFEFDRITSSPSTLGPCFRNDTLCQYRGFVEQGSGNGEGMRGLTFWQLWTARLGFLVIFENFIVIIVGLLAFLIPDIPQTVLNEIRREKVLAYNTIFQRNEEMEEGGGGGGGGQAPASEGAAEPATMI